MAIKWLAKESADARDRRRIRRSLLVLGISLLSIGVVAVSAILTDTATVPNNTFSTGSVSISTSPTSALVSFSGMTPGDQVTAPLTVTNDGSLQLRYAGVSVTTEDVLAAQLDLTIKSGVTTCTNAGFGTDGTVVYATGNLGSTAGTALFGSQTQGAQAGDRVLAASASEVLCFNVSLPSSTGDAFAGLTTTATFTFYAEQTANNP